MGKQSTYVYLISSVKVSSRIYGPRSTFSDDKIGGGGRGAAHLYPNADVAEVVKDEHVKVVAVHAASQVIMIHLHQAHSVSRAVKNDNYLYTDTYSVSSKN